MAHTRGQRRKRRREAEAEAERLNSKLFNAVKQGDVKAAQSLLEQGADAKHEGMVDAGHDFRETASCLFLACRHGRVRLVELLLAHGADPGAGGHYTAVGERRFTPCVRAAAEFRDEARARAIVDALVKAGADPDAETMESSD